MTDQIETLTFERGNGISFEHCDWCDDGDVVEICIGGWDDRGIGTMETAYLNLGEAKQVRDMLTRIIDATER